MRPNPDPITHCCSRSQQKRVSVQRRVSMCGLADPHSQWSVSTYQDSPTAAGGRWGISITISTPCGPGPSVKRPSSSCNRSLTLFATALAALRVAFSSLWNRLWNVGAGAPACNEGGNEGAHPRPSLWRRLWNVGAVVGTLETAVERGRRRGRTEETLDELRVEGEHATKLGDCISAISG